ncbi:Hypothetical predicted protein [Lecanosticta acicola]|uniref:Glycoprotease family protein n=1 Tax=Lecanosticta acicola TaxID=111012 RepID=A0AAI9EES4_9PEZI|nr:Hypothetical predicted protein [Lecanosticta acicola]
MNLHGSRERRKSSHRSRRPFGKLTLDTNFASQGRPFPYESRVQELSFVSFAESKARANVFARQEGLKQQLGNEAPLAPPAQQIAPTPNAQPSSRKKTIVKPSRSFRAAIVPSPTEQKASDASLAPPLHRRVKGLRPSPLDLNQDVSPSDRAITIGLAFAPSTAPVDPKSPSSPPEGPEGKDHESIDTQKFGQEVATPVIVITPAKDRFSPSDLASGYRPTSSIYSRYTNLLTKKNEKTPPVPPLPLFAASGPNESITAPYPYARESAATTFEEDLASPRLRETRLMSTWSDDTVTPMTRFSKRSTAGLPTPRRSKGWWNIITSPFSAKSSNTSFWKSPSAEQSSEQHRILDDAAPMGSDPHAGVIFLNRASDDDALRSAPASGPALRSETEKLNPTGVPKRSDTAPAALDPSAPKVNIYQLPRSGEAAAYYDPNRHFSSLCLSPTALKTASRGSLEGWSPSQSVHIPSRHCEQTAIDCLGPIANDPRSSRAESEICASQKSAEQAEMGPSSPVDEPLAARRSVATGVNIFSTPSEEELRSAGLEIPPASREYRPPPAEHLMSPLSATPVVQDAHLARIVGPHSSFGEQRQVEVESAPTPSHYGLGFATLGAATIAHHEPNEARGFSSEKRTQAKSLMQPLHARQYSHGLGITDSHSDLFPPPQHISEKPRLGTDKFGQLTIRSVEEQRTRRPWYRRFFWLIAAAVTTLLLLLIILLVIFVPQRHNDISVQSTWMNLTGFPVLATGVSTVIQPHRADSSSSCVSPSEMWSCAVPGQNNNSIPDFRFEIRFRNGTLPANETARRSSRASQRKRWDQASALRPFTKRSEWSDYLYSPSPAAPSIEDQKFLGRTTDNVTAIYEGEETPFYISMLEAPSLSGSSDSKLRRRESNFTYPYPTDSAEEQSQNVSTKAPESIPPPALKSNGEPAVQELYPLATAQPLKLYNRGTEDEHYGFYTYFDRSIYVSAPANASHNATANFTGNVALHEAETVCTFSQTRFRVQIWTQKGNVSSSLGRRSASGSIAAAAAGNSTANDMSSPGSFPYPVTVTINRHGGSATRKGVYCYGLDEEHHVVSADKMWIVEDRAAGGSLVNPAEIPGNGTSAKNSKRDDQIYGGIDGGTGGCDCQWRNWK